MSLSRWLAPQRLALSVLASVAALGLFLAASPVARAQLAGVLRVVGGVPFNEVEPQPGEAGSGGEAGTVSELTLSLAEAQANLPFALALPAWVPSAYALQDEVVVTYFAEGTLTFARVVWYSEMGQVIDLRAEYPGGVTWEVGPDSLEEATVNGAPAAVLRGMWNADTNEWVRSSAITLSWRLPLVVVGRVDERAATDPDGGVDPVAKRQQRERAGKGRRGLLLACFHLATNYSSPVMAVSGATSSGGPATAPRRASKLGLTSLSRSQSLAATDRNLAILLTPTMVPASTAGCR
jgi:hypothetical protein